MNSEIYLDANATSATMPAALVAANHAMREHFGNPSSSHAAGLKAKAMLDAVRSRARRLLGAGVGQLTFTSGATEAIQSAVLSALCDIRARQHRGEPVGDLLLYGATEHKAVPECLAHWNELLGTGLALQALAVDDAGQHRLDLLRELAPRAALVCTMAANNETGVISALAAIESVLAECAPAALWLVDSVQAFGKLPMNLAATRIDYAPFSGHKLYAPKGIGMLYVRAGAPYTALMAGGGQEASQRSGTENMAGIAGLGAVLEALEDGATFRSSEQMAAFRERLASALREAFPELVFNMPFEHSLPTTLNFSVPGLASKALLDLFDAAGVRVSSGSACSASTAASSHVLVAMGLPAWRAASALRMSFGPMVDDAFIDAACQRIARCGAALRASCLLPPGSLSSSSSSSSLVLNADVAAIDSATQLEPAALEQFLLTHPDARLVDVREACEHIVGGALAWHGRNADNVPLSRLPDKLAEWLGGEQRPLVFFCRSGKRSAQAAQCLHRLGYHNAWHLAGGLALAS
jgi:cysteine sulfinate desulfinase/cysteine desulfurase-like protein/rhodanese-related sulfurtransferase